MRRGNIIKNRHAFTYNNFDLIGTETIETGTPLDSFTAGLITYDYNNLNQLLSSTNPNRLFAYDDDGNMTQGYTPDGYVYTATYDAENRLKTLAYNDGAYNYETRYFYSGDNLLARIEKWDNTAGSLEKRDEIRYIRAGFLPVQERDGNNNIIHEYTWGLNFGGGIGGLPNLKQNGQDYSYLYDGKGNVMALLNNSDQSINTSYRYDEFGRPLKKAGSLDQPYRFSTKQYDEPTGLTIYPFRFYNPAIGKWMTRDPLGESGDINLYRMTGNNPVNFVDPLGLFPNWIVPTYGNYGAPGYGSGDGTGLDPIDSMDKCFKKHDECYFKHKIYDWDNVDSCQKNDRKQCDRDLANCLADLPLNPFKWENPPPWWMPLDYVILYHDGAQTIFSIMGR